MSSLDTLPLMFEDDSYLLEVETVDTSSVRLVRVLRHEGNLNGPATAPAFFDLSPHCRAAIIRQINRRFTGKTVRLT